MPDYTFDGVGLRIDGVSEGRPASLSFTGIRRCYHPNGRNENYRYL
jgi:hypothetical protein